MAFPSSPTTDDIYVSASGTEYIYTALGTWAVNGTTQNASTIKASYESNANTNVYTDTEQTKLSGIEAGATADQTDVQIKTAYENNANSNAFTDADETKLDGIEAGANVTDAANVNAAGAVMNTDTSTGAMSFVIDQDSFASNSSTKVPTQQSVKAYVDANGGGGAVSSTINVQAGSGGWGQTKTFTMPASPTGNSGKWICKGTTRTNVSISGGSLSNAYGVLVTAVKGPGQSFSMTDTLPGAWNYAVHSIWIDG